jgi:hypothetical protein
LVGEHVGDELGRGHIGAKHSAIMDATFSVPILERAVAPCAGGDPDRGELQDHREIAGLDPDLLTQDRGDSSAIGPASDCRGYLLRVEPAPPASLECSTWDREARI